MSVDADEGDGGGRTPEERAELEARARDFLDGERLLTWDEAVDDADES